MQESGNSGSTRAPPVLTRLLLAAVIGIAGVSAAQATPQYKWQCGQYTVTVHTTGVGSREAGESWGSIVFEPALPAADIRFKWDPDHPPAKSVDEPGDYATFTGGEAFLNGKRCTDYQGSAYQKGVRDYYDGTCYRARPYPDDTEKEKAARWERGFRDAQRRDHDRVDRTHCSPAKANESPR